MNDSPKGKLGVVNEMTIKESGVLSRMEKELNSHSDYFRGQGTPTGGDPADGT